MQNIKSVVVGDAGVGKTCLLLSYTQRQFPLEQALTVFDTMDIPVELDGGHWYNFQPHDTSGGEDYARLRPLNYPQTDVFVVCFSVVDRNSFANVRSVWVPEIMHHMPNAPWVLVGTKTDLREDQETLERLQERGETPVTDEEARALGEELGAESTACCSALRLERSGLDQVIRVKLLQDRPVLALRNQISLPANKCRERLKSTCVIS